MSLPEERKDRYSYQDYVTWPDDERWELIRGQAYDMTPAPTFKHQTVAARFYAQVDAALKGKPCIAGLAPTDVVFSLEDVVQPDFFVVCDRRKITEQNIHGAPDLIIEVSSPSTALKDRREKKALYERYGVREYILADPDARFIERFILQPDGTYGKGEVLGHEKTLTLHSLEGVSIALQEVFRDIVPNDTASERDQDLGKRP